MLEKAWKASPKTEVATSQVDSQEHPPSSKNLPRHPCLVAEKLIQSVWHQWVSPEDELRWRARTVLKCKKCWFNRRKPTQTSFTSFKLIDWDLEAKISQPSLENCRRLMVLWTSTSDCRRISSRWRSSFPEMKRILWLRLWRILRTWRPMPNFWWQTLRSLT